MDKNILGVASVPRTTTLSIAIAIFFSVQCAIALAKEARIETGDGGVGLDAYVQLDAKKELTLGMIGCKPVGNRLKLQLGLYGGDNAPVEFTKRLENTDKPSQLSVCINEVCEAHDWQSLESSSGDGLFTSATLDPDPSKTRSIRVVIPSEKSRHEFSENLSTVLKKICQPDRTQTAQVRSGQPPACNDAEVIKTVVSGTFGKLKAKARQYWSTGSPGPNTPSILRAIDQWDSGIENIRQSRFDDVNNIRFCAASVTWSNDLPATLLAPLMFSPDPSCARAIDYKIEIPLDKPDSFYVSWVCR